MKILIPSIGLGPAGGNRVLCNLATEWIGSGHEVAFLVHEAGGPVYFPTKATIRWFNANGEFTTQRDATTKQLTFTQHNILLCRMIGKLAGTYDLILLNHSMTVLPAILAGTRSKAFYYIQLYEPEVHFASKWLVNKMKAVVLWASYFMVPRQRCIVNSKIYVDYKNIRTSGKIIPPGIDLDLYWQKNFLSIPEKITLGIIGRNEAWKGTSQGIDVLRMLLDRGMNVQLKVAFNFPMDLIKGLENRVEVVIPQNDGELADFYRSVDIMLALGTIQLGAPHYPVIEALACGTLVITTGYLPADEETSYIVPINDCTSAANMVEEIAREAVSVLRQKIEAGRAATLPLAWRKVAADMLSYMLINKD